MLSVLAPQHCAIEYCVCIRVELGLGSISMHIPFKILLGLPKLQTLQCAGRECPISAYAGMQGLSYPHYQHVAVHAEGQTL